MIVSIMQPYLFPYLGYFQLVAASDVFVSFDDVQFIKAGWVNRNRILVEGTCQWLTMPVVSAPQDHDIRARAYQAGSEHCDKILRRLASAYSKAKNFEPTMGLVESIMRFPDRNVAAFNYHALQRIATTLGIRTRLMISSEIEKSTSLSGADRVIEICTRLGATDYLNPIGGISLYHSQTFRQRGIRLRFLECQPPVYDQGTEPFTPFLSIVDVLMHNSASAVAAMLNAYRLIEPDGLPN